jgi:hypothetical protein
VPNLEEVKCAIKSKVAPSQKNNAVSEPERSAGNPSRYEFEMRNEEIIEYVACGALNPFKNNIYN